MGIVKEERIGPHRLILGDCLEVMPLLGKVDAVVTDPPYGIGDRLTSGGSGRGFQNMTSGRAHKWDIKPGQEVFNRIFAMSDAQIIWGGNFHALPPCDKPLCWDKKRPNQKNLSEWEYAWTSLVGRGQMFAYCANGGFISTEKKYHETQKPTPLMQWCLGFLPDAETILDPFMGSGTTLVACAKLGRKGIGIELDPDYFAIACKRVDEAMRQPDLFIQPAPVPVQEGLDL